MHNLRSKLARASFVFAFAAILSACGSPSDGQKCESGVPEFPPEKFDKYDFIRSVRVDPATQDIYFSTAREIYSLRSGDFLRLAERGRGDIFDQKNFWLAGDEMLIPGGNGLLDDLRLTHGDVILSSFSLSLQETRAIIELPEPEVNQRFSVEDVAVLGDDVVWITKEGVTDAPEDFLPDYEDTYIVRKTSWRSPSDPLELYRTDQLLNDLVMVDGRVFIGARTLIHLFSRQVVVSLPDGVLEGNSVDVLGGDVVAADETSLLVGTSGSLGNQNFDDGLFLTTLDGTVIQQIAPHGFSGHLFASNGAGRWAVSFLDEDSTEIHVVAPDGEMRQVACFGDSVSVYGMAFQGNDLLLATLEDRTLSTIRRVPLGLE